MNLSLTRGRRLLGFGMAAATAALAAGSQAAPALAANPQLTVQVSQRWQLATTQGEWIPYVVTVRDEGSTGFSGDLYLVPIDLQTIASNSYPTYHAQLTIARGGQSTSTFYVIDAPSGYQAEVHDDTGKTVAQSRLPSSNRPGTALGILSDVAQADQAINNWVHTESRADASVFRFTSAQDFPNNAVYLSGLSGIIVDQFDTAALSQSQVQALEDFVSLGGALIEAGGPSWRRTLLSLPQELLPMRPSATSTVSLDALAELGGPGRPSGVTQVAAGQVASGQVVLSSADGQPLVVEGPYGSGRIIELAFDPLADPFTSQPLLASLAWAQAISRALSDVSGGIRLTVSTGFGAATSTSFANGEAGPGAWSPGFTSGQDQISSILHDTPADAIPPVGLLGGLLVAYILLAGVLNYLFLKALSRRVLMWVSVPAIALVTTAASYAVGFGGRGTDFTVTAAQVQRLGANGAVESYTFAGVYSPRKGDVSLTMAPNSLVSTTVGVGTSFSQAGEALISSGVRPHVLLSNVGVWSMRSLQSLTVSHLYTTQGSAPSAVDAQVKVQKGHLVGMITNRTSHPVFDLDLISQSGSDAPMLASIGPGASAQVDVDLNALNTGNLVTAREAVRPIDGLSDSSRAALVRLAASQAIARPGELALIGFAPATDSVSIDGSHAGHGGVAALVEPVSPQAVDDLATLAPRARLVSTVGSTPDSNSTMQVDVYDFDLAPGLTAQIGLNYSLPRVAVAPNGQASSAQVQTVDVYNWDTRTWRPLPAQSAQPAQSSQPAPLQAGEESHGVVRVRVEESLPFQSSQLSLGDVPTS